jgi:hypothetical protein
VELGFRRLFLSGLAAFASLAALIGIFAVLGGGFGRTQFHVLLTGLAAVGGGGTLLAGLALRERNEATIAAWAALAAGLAAFLVWFWNIWGSVDATYVELVMTWWAAVTVVAIVRLVTEGGVLYGVTSGCALFAALFTSFVIVGERGTPWQPAAVLAILTVLGFVLAPIVKRLR